MLSNRTFKYNISHKQLDKSNNSTVRLRNVSLKTSGLFKCEVSLDAPNFLTKFMQRKMHIFRKYNTQQQE